MGNQYSSNNQHSEAFLPGTASALGNRLTLNRNPVKPTSFYGQRAHAPTHRTVKKIRAGVRQPNNARCVTVWMSGTFGVATATGPPEDSDANKINMNNKYGSVPENTPIIQASVDAKIGNFEFGGIQGVDVWKGAPKPFDFKQAQYSSYIEMIKQKQSEMPQASSIPDLSDEVSTLQKNDAASDVPDTKGKLQTALVNYEKHINEFKSKSNELLKIRSLYNEKKDDQEYYDKLSYMFWQYYELKAQVSLSRQTLEDAYKEANEQSNQQQSEIKADNEPIFGVIPQGWGSVTVGKIDDDTGELVEINRHPTQDDLSYVANYLNFLNAQWELSKDSIEDPVGSGQDIADKMVKMFDEQPMPKQLGVTEEELDDPEFQDRLNKLNNKNGLTKDLENYNKFSRAKQFMRNFNISRWQKPQAENQKQKIEQSNENTIIDSKKEVFQKLDEDVQKLLEFEQYLEKGIDLKFNFLTEADYLNIKQIIQNPDIPQHEKDALKMEMSRQIADRINEKLDIQTPATTDLAQNNSDFDIQAQLFRKLDEDMRNLKRLDQDKNLQANFHFVSKNDIIRIKEVINSETASDEEILIMKAQLGKDIAARMQEEVAKLNVNDPPSLPTQGQIKIPVQDAKGFRVLNQQEMADLPGELQAMADQGQDLSKVTIYKVDAKDPNDDPQYIVIYKDPDAPEEEPTTEQPAMSNLQYRNAEFDDVQPTKKEAPKQQDEFDQSSPLADFENSPQIGSLGLNEQLSVEVKRRELNKKFIIKNNLNKIFGGAQDNRSENWSQYFNKLSQIYRREIYSNVDTDDNQSLMDADLFAQPENLKSFVISRPQLSMEDKNQIFHLHNSASNDEKYGQRLLHYVLELVADGKLEEKDDYRIFIYSIDWPVDIQIDRIYGKALKKKEEQE